MAKRSSSTNGNNNDGNRKPDLDPGFLVVGIGASAGGIQALANFFANVSADSGAAYVVILHLSPDHESHLAQVLQQTATIPVEQVTKKTKIAPGHVYVVSPDKSLSMRDGHIVVQPIKTVEERRAPVDIFFRTLAESHGPNAVGVILSGTGANGSMGIKRIKEFGGAAFAQNPREAEFNEMPRNSIATGLVDSILPVREIPGKILSYRNHRSVVAIADDPVDRSGEQQNALREIFTQIRVRTGHDFSNYKRPTILRRVERRIGVRNLPDIESYAAYLRENPDETQGLLKDLLISVTNFFRDKRAFEAIEKNIIPRLLKERDENQPIRVWVPGCATGEEAYSLAMLFAEQTMGEISAPPVQIFATDIDEQSIAIGREAVYTLNDAADVSPERLRRFFTKEGESYRIRREIREMVLFAQHNLIKDPPFSHLDLVSCRNLLIYFNHVAQERAFEIIHFALEPERYLLIGSSESVDGSADLFATVDKENHIFQSRQVTTRPLPVPESVPIYQSTQREPSESGRTAASVDRITYNDLHLKLLDQIAPPSLVVNEDYEIVHISERAGKYLQVVGGEPTNNFLRLVHSDIRMEVRGALFQATQQKTNVEARGLKINFGDRVETINLLIRPVISESDTARGYTLVVFEPSADGEHLERETYAPPEPVAQALEEELVRSRSQLHSALEQSEIQSEELRASNEELQAMNEELRSSAEELETSKEELQSINEELTTVNQELKVKIEELSNTNNNFNNLLRSIDIGVVFLDRSLRVALFSPAAAQIFNLIPGDTGRPLSDITSKLNYHEHEADSEIVIEKLQTVEREVESVDGRVFMMQMVPYRTFEDRINGVVMTFVDITVRKRVERSLSESEEQFRRAIEDAPIPVIMHAEDGEVLQISRTWTTLTGYTLKDVPTVDAWLTLAYGQGASDVRLHMHELFQGDRASLNIEFPIRTRDGERRHWSFSASSPGTLRDGRRFIVGMAVDVTDKISAADALRRSEEKYRRLFDSMDEGYCILQMVYDDAGLAVDFRFLQVNRAFESNNGLHDAEGKTIRDLAPDIEPKWIEIYDDVARNGKARRFEEDSEALGRVFSLYAFRIGDPDEHKVAVIFTDITDKKRANDVLGFQAQLLNTVEQSVISTDLEGRISYWNKYAEKMFGWRSGEVIGRRVTEINIPEEEIYKGEEIMESLRRGNTWSGDFVLKRKDGSTFTAHVLDTPITDENGELIGIVGVSIDITERLKTESALRTSEERLRLMMESFTDVAIFTTDVNSVVTAWNPGAEKIFGFKAEEMVGKQTADIIFTPEDRAKGACEKERREAREKGKALDERWHIRKNGERFFASGFMVPLTDGETLIGYAKIASDLTERKHFEEQLKGAQQDLEKRVASRTQELADSNETLKREIAERMQAEKERVELLRRIVTTQEDERRRIARDLHDHLGQQMTSMRLQLQSILEECGDHEICDKVKEVQRQAEHLDRGVDFLAWELRPAALDDLGLRAALANFVKEWSSYTGIPAEFHANGLGRTRLAFDIETNLYRIAQEALNNVQKHSKAKNVSVLLEKRGLTVTLIVEDDGVGLDAKNRKVRRRGLGLEGMKERAAIIDGTLEIESEPGKGTTIFAKVPAKIDK